MYWILKVKIVDVTPQVWRRVVVNDELTFMQLHNVLQISLGWLSYHMFSFEVGDYRLDYDPLDENDVELNVNDIKLSEMPLNEKMKFQYIYDFGDYWEHEITIEKITDKGPILPVCKAGNNNCPIEDCGGPEAYVRLVKQLKSGKMDEETRAWVGAFDPKEFDIDEVNDILSDPDILNEDYL